MFQQNFLEFKKGLMEFGLNFNALVNLIILSLVYLLGIGPTSIVAKVFGKHFLSLKIARSKKSYWVKPDKTSDNISDSLKQF